LELILADYSITLVDSM